ncbi:accessory Sec system protein Asp3 [Streptococcus halichoeri]|uniref:accessory Sec system protein Asp3 n=1 Tax=Streptococcus halichoeri TaxID=254785 RepID=UPI001C8D11AC|nr:accessory Sec system protein Asp3 [Streptococcus halichoeri]
MTKTLILHLKPADPARCDKYLYGTHLATEKGQLVFDNPCIAPGKALLSWHSKRHYQAHRVCPDLPLLIPGDSYELTYQVQVLSGGACYLQVSFKNQQDELLEVLTLRDQQGLFTCPVDTDHYDISLMSAGCHQLRFQELKLYACEAQKVWQEAPKAKSYQEQDLPAELDLICSLIPLA